MNFDIKEVSKQLRKDIIDGAVEGGYSQRYRLLALAFLRGLSYRTLEKTTQGDNHCLIGRNTYYGLLPYCVAYELCKQFGTERPRADAPIVLAVREWINKEY